jgi:hypothetical protein
VDAMNLPEAAGSSGGGGGGDSGACNGGCVPAFCLCCTCNNRLHRAIVSDWMTR